MIRYSGGSLIGYLKVFTFPFLASKSSAAGEWAVAPALSLAVAAGDSGTVELSRGRLGRMGWSVSDCLLFGFFKLRAD
jgi:hypothetical protein